MFLRPLLFLTFSGLMLLPDWSAAGPLRRRNSGPLPCPASYSYPAPVVYAPVYSTPCCPVVVEPSVCCPIVTPAPVVVPKGPQVIPERMAEPRAVEPKPGRSASMEDKSNPTGILPVVDPMPNRGVTLEEKPTPAPIRPVAAEEKPLPAPSPIPVPNKPVIREEKPLPTRVPQVGTEERLPPVSVPMRPVDEPKFELPKAPMEFAAPRATQEESQKPAPRVDSGTGPIRPTPKTEAPSEKLPSFELPMKPAKSDALPEFQLPIKETPTDSKSGLPKFDLPSLPLAPLPTAPTTPAVPQIPTVTKSSPLNLEPIADIYPVSGEAPTDPNALRSVGFVNKSDRDLVLTVAGKMTTLPSGHYLQVNLPMQFTWQIGGEKAREVTIPSGNPGVDVVIRR